MRAWLARELSHGAGVCCPSSDACQQLGEGRLPGPSEQGFANCSSSVRRSLPACQERLAQGSRPRGQRACRGTEGGRPPRPTAALLLPCRPGGVDDGLVLLLLLVCRQPSEPREPTPPAARRQLTSSSSSFSSAPLRCARPGRRCRRRPSPPARSCRCFPASGRARSRRPLSAPQAARATLPPPPPPPPPRRSNQPDRPPTGSRRRSREQPASQVPPVGRAQLRGLRASERAGLTSAEGGGGREDAAERRGREASKRSTTPTPRGRGRGRR